MTELVHLDAEQAQPLVDHLVEIYVRDIYADDPVFSNEDNFRRQLATHMPQPGWELVTASEGGEIVGYIYGFTLTEDSDWWKGLTTAVPDGFTDEDGNRTLAISELVVRAPWRRQGIAAALHGALLDGRREQRATLLVQPSYAAAQAAYARWGWQKVAQLQPTWPQAPLYDVMIRPLTDNAA